MLSNLNFKIKDIGPVKKVDIDIGKINVVGGLNATGKSTVSKLLYCILKGNIANRQDFAYSLIMPSIRGVVKQSQDFELNELFNLSDDEFLDIYNKVRNEIAHDSLSDYNWDEESRLNQIKKIERQMAVIEKNDNELYFSILRRTLTSEFSSVKFNGTMNLRGVYNDIPFDYDIDLRNRLLKNSSIHSFFSVSDVNYIDSHSLLDITPSRLVNRRKNERMMHILHSLYDDSEALEFLDEEFNEKIIEAEETINDLIRGRFESKNGKFTFISNEGHETFMEDTSSGIKQIGIIQILLANRKIKEDSFLIIDEPEVNLHPEWQIKFAEILCILAHDLNVHIYINTHSPLFIESMSIFSEYYYLKDESNFYLTEKQGNGFTFKSIANDDMGAVYENLSRPYDDLDEVKAEILFRN